MQKNETRYGCGGLTAVITGGTSGIGLAAAEKLLLDGAQVYILSRYQPNGSEALRLLQAKTGRLAAYIPCDVTDAASCRAALQLLSDGGFHIDLLVNAAGIYFEQRLESMTEYDYQRVMDVNVKGTLLMTQAALPYMYSGGSIVNIASDAGVSGNYGCPLYCASKGAVVALTRALALDLAPRIRVNCVCPADVDTPLLERQLAAGGYTLAEMAQGYPLERVGRAEEIAHVICSLLSPANSFMTGSIVMADGGLTAK